MPPHCQRRRLLASSAGAVVAASGRPDDQAARAADESLERRFTEDQLEKLPTGSVNPWGPSDIFMPNWTEGYWHVRAVLTNYSVPLGLYYLSNGGRNQQAAEKAIAEQRKRVGTPEEYDLRFMRTQSGNVVEDRTFNTAQRINAYAGRKVIKFIEYVDVPGNTREDALKRGDGFDDPLLSVLITFKGRVQKVFVTGFSTETSKGADGADIWRSSQSTRTLLAAPGSNYNPFAVDEEVLTEMRQEPGGAVTGRVRLLGFLNPSDELYFSAGSKAVTIADYALTFTKIQEPASEAAARAKFQSTV